MKNQDLRVIWCVDLTRLSTLPFIQLENQIKQSVIEVGDLVSRWFLPPEPEDRTLAKIIHLN